MNMSNCGNCGKCGCESCGGCLELTAGEVALLEQLGQYAFLPVARLAGDMTPVYGEAGELSAEECSILLQLLERKNLISLDYDQPLKAYAADWYLAYPVRGSFALTRRGQQVLDQLQTQGIQ